MRKVLIWATAILLVPAVIIGVVGGNGGQAPNPELNQPTAAFANAIQAAKNVLEAEKQVESVFLDEDQAGEWQIAMVNDGSSRIGFANYVCEVLNEHGAAVTGTYVKIIDAANLLIPTQQRNMRGMGTVSCDDRRTISEGDLTPVARKY